MPDQQEAVDLDVSAVPELVEDEDGDAVLLRDEYGALVRIALRPGMDSYWKLRKLARRLEIISDARRDRELGRVQYQHGPHTGPGASR